MSNRKKQFKLNGNDLKIAMTRGGAVPLDKFQSEKKIEAGEVEQGMRFNHGKLEWDLVSFKSLEPLVKVLMYGAHKYSVFEDEAGNKFPGYKIPMSEAGNYKLVSSGANNWKKGLPLNKILESLTRHLVELKEVADCDEESKLQHIGHILCNAMFYSYFVNVKK